MLIELNINDKVIRAHRGDTILEVLKRVGIEIPTLCHMDGLSPTGACRLCVIELEGSERLLPSCSLKAEEGMKIWTHSNPVLTARKTSLELLLAKHPQDCLFCVRNRNCQLQKLASDFHIQQRRFPSTLRPTKIDGSSESIIIDPAKCILCARCVRVCTEVMKVGAIDLFEKGLTTRLGTPANNGLHHSDCIHCGQCTLVCPSGAIHEKDSTEKVLQALSKSNSFISVSYAPELGVSLGEEMGFGLSKDLSPFLPALLRKMGFNRVFDASLGNDIHISLVAQQILHNLSKGEVIPVFSSSCPSWLTYVEKKLPEIKPYLAKAPIPQDITAALNSLYDKSLEEKKEHTQVAIVPCTAYKSHILSRTIPEGLPATGIVLTTREFVHLVRVMGIDLKLLPEELCDDPFQHFNYSTRMMGVSGGSTESIARELVLRHSGQELANARISKVRSSREVKEIRLLLGKKEYAMIAVNGLAALAKRTQEFLKRKDLLFVEVMACPGACVNGGGQPVHPEEVLLKSRAKKLVDTDAAKGFKAAPRIQLMEQIDLLLKETGMDAMRTFLTSKQEDKGLI